ncbi:hypothetical protein TNCV_2880931 [Trichonephila clavipes]|nr:hypothetical protein TNCV_2880931 [Trichonephila clavipes]
MDRRTSDIVVIASVCVVAVASGVSVGFDFASSVSDGFEIFSRSYGVVVSDADCGTVGTGFESRRRFNILKDNEGRRKQHSRSFMARREPRVLTLGQS